MSYVYVIESPQLSSWVQSSGLGWKVVKIGCTKEQVRLRHLELMVEEYGGVKDWLWDISDDVYTNNPFDLETKVHTELKNRGLWLNPSNHENLKNHLGNQSMELFVLPKSEALDVIRKHLKASHHISRDHSEHRPDNRVEVKGQDDTNRVWSVKRIVFYGFLMVLMGSSILYQTSFNLGRAGDWFSIPQFITNGDKQKAADAHPVRKPSLPL